MAIDSHPSATLSKRFPLGLLRSLLAMAAIPMLAACAAVSHKATFGEPSYYRESASDVANRAPQSMSLPEQGPSLPLDDQALREQADYHFSLGDALALDGNSAKAIEEYRLALVYDQNSASIRLRLANEYVKQGLVSEAMEQAKIAIELQPSAAEGYLLLGGLQSALRLYDDALATYRKAKDLDPEGSEAAMFIGALLAEQKKYAESVQTFEALAKRPKNSSSHLAWYYLGRVRLEQNPEKNRREAERDLRAAIAARPSFVDAVSALAAVYEATGRKSEAIQLYRSFQAKHGPDAGVAENLARLYLEDKRYGEALEQLEVVEASDPENLNARMKAAFVLIEQKRYKEAVRRLEDILAKAPDSDKIRFYLGAVFEEIKDFSGAISAFEKVPPTSSYYAEAVVHAAYLQKVSGDPAKAIETIEDALKRKDEHPQFYSLYASFLDDAKEYPKALMVLQKATKRFPEHAQLRFFLGSMQDRVGDHEGMVASMRKVLELDDNHVQALNYLAYTFAEKETKLDEAEKLVRRAVQLQPKDGYIMDTLGWVLFKRGEVTEAVKILEAAHRLAPKEAVIAEHLGDAYYKNQLPEKAKKMYLKATETDASPENARKIRSKIVAIDRQISPTSDMGRAPASDRAAIVEAPDLGSSPRPHGQ